MAIGDHVLEQDAKNPNFKDFFDMARWSSVPDDGGKKILKHRQVIRVNGECGTTGCLLGHGTNVPMLRRIGLRAIYDKHGNFVKIGIPDKGIYTATVNNSRLARILFGISDDRFNEIFMYRTMSHCSPWQAVNHLKEVVRDIDKKEGWIF